ncbi:hypothetical protein [Streptomyces sp. NPDC004721]
MAAGSAQAGAARLTRNRLRSAVTRAGRQRRIEAETDRLLEVFRRTWLRQPALVEQAMGRQTLALLAQLDAACQSCDDLAHDTEELFLQHPDAEIITSRSAIQRTFGVRRGRGKSRGARWGCFCLPLPWAGDGSGSWWGSFRPKPIAL